MAKLLNPIIGVVKQKGFTKEFVTMTRKINYESQEVDEKTEDIFSDDSDWCEDQELFSDDRFLVSKGNSPYHDLYLMSRCKNFIIANSSFSWWGAWLSNYDKVIAPSKWFGVNNADKKTDDV